MAGLHGGFAGRGLSDFSEKSTSLKLRPPIDSPLFPIRRYLCLEPIISLAPLPGPPPMVGEFIPLIVSEDLIISEPWEDAAPPAIFNYAGDGNLISGGIAEISKTNVYIGSGDLVTGGAASVSQGNEYIGNGGLTFGGAGTTEGPPEASCCTWFFSDEFLSS